LARVPGGFGVRRPDRRILPGSFTLDPGMRAGDEFTDVSSEGYNEWAKRAAERGGAKEYATSVEEEGAAESAATKRDWLLMALMTLVGGRGLGQGMSRVGTNPRLMPANTVGPVGPQQFTKYQRGQATLDQVLGHAMAGIGAGGAVFGEDLAGQSLLEAIRGVVPPPKPERRGWLDEVQRMRRG